MESVKVSIVRMIHVEQKIAVKVIAVDRFKYFHMVQKWPKLWASFLLESAVDQRFRAFTLESRLIPTG